MNTTYRYHKFLERTEMKKNAQWLPCAIKTLLVCFFLLAPTAAYAEDLIFTWTANPEPVTGYKLYYKTGTNGDPPYNGTGLNEGNSPIDVGKVTEFTVTGRDVTQTYQFVLTAYNDQVESDYTNPVAKGPLDDTAPEINLIRLN